MTSERLPPDHELLAESDVDTYRASGPGGQKRNKTESAVRLRHRPSGLIVIAEESRSQPENKARALRRLRKAMAVRLRHPSEGEGIPPEVQACIDRRGKLDVGQRDARYLPAVAAALDVFVACRGSVSETAKRLGVSTANLSSFLTEDDEVFVETNRLRETFGLKPLRRR